MDHVEQLLNFRAIFVSAILLWLLGALWFSPLLFAKPWSAMVGRPEDEKPKGVAHGMVSSFIGDLLVALVLAHIILWAHGTRIRFGILIGFIAWVGFIAAEMYPQRIYEGRPFGYFLIVGGYWLVGLLVIGGLLAFWR